MTGWRRALLPLVAAGIVGIGSSFPRSSAEDPALPAGKLQLGQSKLAPQADGLKPGEAKPLPASTVADKSAPIVPDAISLPIDNAGQKQLEAARDYIREEAWAEACKALQSLLETKEDGFVRVLRRGGDGKEVPVLTSVRAEANRLVSSMPEKGRESYRSQYSPLAADLLKRARKDRDTTLLAQVAQRYLYTDAGPEALELLGRDLFDHGDYTLAARTFERLLAHQALARWTPERLFQATAAFRRAGAADGAEKTWRELEGRISPGGLRLGERLLNRAEMRQELDRIAPTEAPGLAEWPMFRGNPSRSAHGVGGPAFLEAQWRVPTSREQFTREWLRDAMTRQETRMQPVLPAFFPITATIKSDGKSIPLVIYLSYWGVHAVDARTGKLRWEWDTEWSIDRMAKGMRVPLPAWANLYMQSSVPQILWENSVTGTLSTDGRRVYLIEDMGVPPPSEVEEPRGDARLHFATAALAAAAGQNRLQAIDAKTGKLVWILGGREEPGGRPCPELRDSHFLAPPLPLEGKLYVLTEKNQELRLVCLDGSKNPYREDTIVWMQTLATVPVKLLHDPVRRTQAAHLAQGQGILVCSTNSGAILGVDLLTHELFWAHVYRDKAAVPAVAPARRLPVGPMLRTAIWKTSAPVIQDGKVVFAAPDAGAVHCLNLKDGALLWSVPHLDHDLYLAGAFGGKVLLVGKHSVRAVNLADGKPAWKELETGLPSGQGVAVGHVYYLPLKSGATTKAPEVCAIDLDKGVIQGHTRLVSGEVPGNLLFFDGLMISQTAEEIRAYPEMKKKLEQLDKGRNEKELP